MVRILVSKKLKLGVVGLVHDHVWGLLQQFREISVVEIKAVADPNQELIDRVIDMFGIKEKYHNYGEMLAKAELDAILLCNENARHADVVEIAAEKGIHVMMEKPMAATLAQADRILRAENNYGIKVMVNYPTAWNPAIRHAHKLVNEGKIGNIFHIRYRGAHAGPKEVGCSPYFYDWLYDIKLNGGGGSHGLLLLWCESLSMVSQQEALTSNGLRSQSSEKIHRRRGQRSGVDGFRGCRRNS
jgi:predicted dehydrogenase